MAPSTDARAMLRRAATSRRNMAVQPPEIGSVATEPGSEEERQAVFL